MKKYRPRVLFALIVLTASVAGGEEANRVVKVVPEETDELLSNPGIGWQTFHRNKQDTNLPSWVPSTVHYARWGWGELEPQPGKIDYAFLDKMLKESRESGQKLAFRVMCCSTSRGRPYHPKWLKEVGGRELDADHGRSTGLVIPDFDDPDVLEKHLDFIKRLGARYDGHPDIDHLDLGSIGWWGEWHMTDSKRAKMPSRENCRKVVEAYFAAFPKTTFLIPIGAGVMGADGLKPAIAKGAGWRADSLGDLGSFSSTWNHMRNGYPAWIRETQVQDVWKTAPVAFEPPGEVREYVDKRWPLRFIFNYGLACHGSYYNGKSGRLPDDEQFRQELGRFLRRLGYRLVLRELAHPAQARSGEKLQLGMKWQNVGSAPCYRPYRVAYRLADPQGTQRVVVGGVAVNRWLPGSIELFTEEFFREIKDLPPGELAAVEDAVVLPEDLPRGVYTLSVAVVDGSPPAPVVRLGIKGRADDGWYPLSKIEVVQ